MPFDIQDALHHLSTAPAHPIPVEGAPAVELARSPAAAAVGRLAARDELLLYHFETRALLDLPPQWVAPGADPTRPTWTDGVLPEPKYASFRHDLPIGSFHPGHRAKWATHELCHALVGFAWRPGASPLFHAVAGRLAELVPVVLWYFLDEVRLRRCPRHAQPLFRRLCPACEGAAAEGPRPIDPAIDHDALAQARRFVDRELAAVARTLRLGSPCAHVWGSLDLSSDGVAYAAAHTPRLTSGGFAAFAERYLEADHAGAHRSLEALEARAVEVLQALTTGAELRPLGGDRRRWLTQDVAARLLQAVGGDPDDAGPLWDLLDAGDPLALVQGYADRARARGWPHPGDVFAVGYGLWGAGHAVDQIDEGLRTVVPTTLQLADDADVDWAEPFTAHLGDSERARRPLGLRFADWLGQLDPVLGGLARYEACLRHPRVDPETLALGDDGEPPWDWAEGVVRWRGPFDPVSLAEAVDSGAMEARASDRPAGVELPAVEPRPTQLVMGRDRDGGLVLAQVPPDVDHPADADAGVCDELRALGLLRPARWLM